MTFFSSFPFVIDFVVRSAPHRNDFKLKQWKVNTLHGQWIEWLQNYFLRLFHPLFSTTQNGFVFCIHIYVHRCLAMHCFCVIRVEGLILSFLQHLLLAPIDILKALNIHWNTCKVKIIDRTLSSFYRWNVHSYSFHYDVSMYANEWISVNIYISVAFLL